MRPGMGIGAQISAGGRLGRGGAKVVLAGGSESVEGEREPAQRFDGQGTRLRRAGCWLAAGWPAGDAAAEEAEERR